jgi:hypothetical protein
LADPIGVCAVDLDDFLLAEPTGVWAVDGLDDFLLIDPFGVADI